MGHWILEASKFAAYVGLPLTTFIVFNSPEYYTHTMYKWQKNNPNIYRGGMDNNQEEENLKEVARLQEEYFATLNKK